jgi:hypothetical protein
MKITKTLKLISKIVATLVIIGGLFYGSTVIYYKVINLIPGDAKPAPGTGDPGNVRLNKLANDPIFHTLPLGCHQDGKLQKSPAEWRPFHKTWDGPSVTLDFNCPNLSESAVGDFINNVAVKSGWVLDGDDRNIPDTWHKKLKYGVEEDSILYIMGNNLNTSLPSPSWELDGSTDAINSQ